MNMYTRMCNLNFVVKGRSTTLDQTQTFYSGCHKNLRPSLTRCHRRNPFTSVRAIVVLRHFESALPLFPPPSPSLKLINGLGQKCSTLLRLLYVLQCFFFPMSASRSWLCQELLIFSWLSLLHTLQTRLP